jgi:hypothetical protein
VDILAQNRANCLNRPVTPERHGAFCSAMRNDSQFQRGFAGSWGDLGHLARPESVVMLTATVRIAREMQRRARVEGLKERVFDGGYTVSSKDLARMVLSTKV